MGVEVGSDEGREEGDRDRVFDEMILCQIEKALGGRHPLGDEKRGGVSQLLPFKKGPFGDALKKKQKKTPNISKTETDREKQNPTKKKKGGGIADYWIKAGRTFFSNGF